MSEDRELSLQQTARALGVHWTTVHRALKRQEVGGRFKVRGTWLRARRDDAGTWRIAVPDVEACSVSQSDVAVLSHLAAAEAALRSAHDELRAIRRLVHDELRSLRGLLEAPG